MHLIAAVALALACGMAFVECQEVRCLPLSVCLRPAGKVCCFHTQ